MATFCYVSGNGKVNKLAYLAECRLDLAEIWYRRVFLDSKSKTNNKTLILRHSGFKVT